MVFVLSFEFTSQMRLHSVSFNEDSKMHTSTLRGELPQQRGKSERWRRNECRKRDQRTKGKKIALNCGERLKNSICVSLGSEKKKKVEWKTGEGKRHTCVSVRQTLNRAARRCRTVPAPPASVSFCVTKTDTRTQKQRERVTHVCDSCKMANMSVHQCSEQLWAHMLHWLSVCPQIQSFFASLHLLPSRSLRQRMFVIFVKTFRLSIILCWADIDGAPHEVIGCKLLTEIEICGRQCSFKYLFE